MGWWPGALEDCHRHCRSSSDLLLKLGMLANRVKNLDLTCSYLFLGKALKVWRGEQTRDDDCPFFCKITGKLLASLFQIYIAYLQLYASFFRSYDSVDNAFPTQQPSRHSDLGETSETQPSAAPTASQAEGAEIKPLVIHFKATLQGLVIGASLLPSLRAQYKVSRIYIKNIPIQPIDILTFASKSWRPILLCQWTWCMICNFLGY